MRSHARSDIHDGREHKTLQSEAGYIDARPHQQLDENLLQRTAGPYIRVRTNKTHSENNESAFGPIATKKLLRSRVRLRIGTVPTCYSSFGLASIAGTSLIENHKVLRSDLANRWQKRDDVDISRYAP